MATRLLVESGLAAGDRVVIDPRSAPRDRAVRAHAARVADATDAAEARP